MRKFILGAADKILYTIKSARDNVERTKALDYYARRCAALEAAITRIANESTTKLSTSQQETRVAASRCGQLAAELERANGKIAELESACSLRDKAYAELEGKFKELVEKMEDSGDPIDREEDS